MCTENSQCKEVLSGAGGDGGAAQVQAAAQAEAEASRGQAEVRVVRRVAGQAALDAAPPAGSPRQRAPLPPRIWRPERR